MSPERESTPKNIVDIAILNPEQFSYGSDRLVDYQINQSTFDNLVKVLKQGRSVVLVTNHQSYFEIETQRHFSQLIKQSVGDSFNSYLLYSAPAVECNVGPLLAIRNPTYQQSGLNLLGIIRDEDRIHPKYKENITPEMEIKNRNNRKFFNEVLYGTSNLFFLPFESTLEGGRLDLKNQKIKGLQPAKPNCLNAYINRNILILPCGIDGSYKLLDPDTHLPSPYLINSILNGKGDDKLVTFKIGSLIDPQSQLSLGLSPEIISQNTIVEVARLIRPESRGVYSQFCK